MQLVIERYKCPSWNELNRSMHWSVRGQIRDELHRRTVVALREALPRGKRKERFDHPVHLTIEAQFSGSNRRDADNLFVKPIQDALVAQGVLKDDSGKYIASLTLSVKTKMPEDRVIITITSVS